MLRSLLGAVDASLALSAVALIARGLYSRSRKQTTAYSDLQANAQILVVNTVAECDAALKQLLAQETGGDESPLCVAIDAEWKPVKHAKTALLQLATQHTVVLVRLHHLLKDPASLSSAIASAVSAQSETETKTPSPSNQFPNSLCSFLADPRILKVGVGCTQDAKKLFNDYGLVVRGCVELAALAARTLPDFELVHLHASRQEKILVTDSPSSPYSPDTLHPDGQIDPHSVKADPSHHAPVLKVHGASLQKLCKLVLDVDLPKPQHIVCSNWEAEPLSQTQILYAAADAYYGIQIFHRLFQHKQGSAKNPFPYNASNLLHWCQGLIDIAAKKSTNSNGTPKNPNKPPKQKHVRRELTEEQRRRRSPSTKHLYENCKMLSPSGELMASCPASKIRWYIEHGLAQQVDSHTIQLNFTPKGKGHADSPFAEYYLTEQYNRCVTCGSEEKDNFRKHRVIPYCYRRYFPAHYKNHTSHDIVLLCGNCHLRAGLVYANMFNVISQQYNVPLNTPSLSSDPESLDQVKLARSAMALIRNSKRLPEARKQQLLEIVSRLSGKPLADLTPEALKEIHENTRETYFAGSPQKEEETHGYLVAHQLLAGKVINDDGDVEMTDKETALNIFCRRWRQYFLDSMQPKFLNPGWSVNYVPHI